MVQKTENILDVFMHSYTMNPINEDPIQDPGHLEEHYRKWFETLGDSGAHRDFCRIKITNIMLGKRSPHTSLQRARPIAPSSADIPYQHAYSLSGKRRQFRPNSLFMFTSRQASSNGTARSSSVTGAQEPTRARFRGFRSIC